MASVTIPAITQVLFRVVGHKMSVTSRVLSLPLVSWASLSYPWGIVPTAANRVSCHLVIPGNSSRILYLLSLGARVAIE